MKKTISVILVAAMLISTLVSLVVPTAAAEDEKNMWKVMPMAYYVEALEEDPNDPSISPLPGYHYTDKGFETISPDYTNYGPIFSVVSQDRYSLDDFSMTFELTDYACSGDNWFSFSVWDRCNGMAQGSTSGKYGYGWTSMVRDSDSNGVFDAFQQFDQSKNKFDEKAKYDYLGVTQNFCTEPETPQEQGSLTTTFTFTIKEGKMAINGVPLLEKSNDVLAKQFKDGLAYIALTVCNSDETGKHSPVITITDVNGEKPQGDISAEPESRHRDIGEMRPSSSVPANTPAILFDASYENEGSLAANESKPAGQHCDVSYSADSKNFLVTANDTYHYLRFGVKDAITYNANDFRMVAILFKNLCTCASEEGTAICDTCITSENIHVRYCAGEVTSPDEKHRMQMTAAAVNVVDKNGDVVNKDEHYILAYAYIDDMDDYKDRIHAMRFDIDNYIDYGVDGKNQYEVAWAGIFAGGSDLLNYIYNGGYGVGELADLLLADKLIEEKDIPADVNVGDTEDTTTAPTETTTEDATTTASEDTTTAKVEKTTEAQAEEKSGCGSVVSMGAIAIVTVVAGTGIVTFKKKKED